MTPSVCKLVLQRLTHHVALIDRSASGLDAKKKTEIKLALLIVHIINPFEEFFATEEALIRGVARNTLAKRKEESRRDPARKLKQL